LASANLDTQLSTIDTVVDSILVDTAEIGAAGAGLTALATQASVNTIDDFLDTEVAAIKAKTDQLTFTVANQVDSNALSGAGGLDAAGIRAAVGLASANLDTQLSTIDTVVDAILVDTAEIGVAGAGFTAIPWNAAWDAEVQSECTDALNAYAPAVAADISTEVFGFNVDGTLTFKEVTQIIAASTAGKVSGAPGSPVFRDLDDTQDVITATVDSSGNRTAITYNPVG
jgi:Rieske Fe-S protein